MTLVKNPCKVRDMFEWPLLLFGERCPQSSQPELGLWLHASVTSVQPFVTTSLSNYVMPFTLDLSSGTLAVCWP